MRCCLSSQSTLDHCGDKGWHFSKQHPCQVLHDACTERKQLVASPVWHGWQLKKGLLSVSNADSAYSGTLQPLAAESHFASAHEHAVADRLLAWSLTDSIVSQLWEDKHSSEGLPGITIICILVFDNSFHVYHPAATHSRR